MDAKPWNGGPVDDDPEGEAHAMRLAEEAAHNEPACPLCEARDGEGHDPACPLFLPLCACGRAAQRNVAGYWTCTKCAPHGQQRSA